MSFPSLKTLPYVKSPALWRRLLRTNFTRLDLLSDFLQLNEVQKLNLLNRPSFALNLPLRLADKIVKGTLDDPILKQFLPTIEENELSPGFVSDPVGDSYCRKESKLLHKYEGRVLLVCTSACAMHCRYCFRQNFNYECEDKTFEQELAIIRGDSSIHEVILSGGDPLSLSNEIIESLLSQLAQMTHIRRIRFHTRFPIGIPERIDEEFLDLIANLEKQVWFVIHTNHPRELDQDIFNRLRELQKLGCTILN